MAFKIPKTITFSGERLHEMKVKGSVPREALDWLISRSDELMSAELPTVPKRNMHPINGNIHQYCSMGTYWWPNPDTPDGLPFIRKDGYTNPTGKETHTPQKMMEMAFDLALAAYYTEDTKYLCRAKEVIRAWYLDEETYMEPNAEYAQSIPGICTGRGIGLIDFSQSFLLMEAVLLIEAMDGCDEKFSEGIREWYRKFTDWMLTSENGLSVANYPNNHGTWYYVQILAAAVFTDRPTLAKVIIERAYDSRHRAHVNENGSIPHELSRTQAYGYTLFDLKGLLVIANIAERFGDTRYISPDPERGTIIMKDAIDFICDCIMNPENYPYTELHIDKARNTLPEFLVWAQERFGGDYLKKAEPLLAPDMRWRVKPMF